MLHKPLPLHMSKWAKLETLTSNDCFHVFGRVHQTAVCSALHFSYRLASISCLMTCKRGRGIMIDSSHRHIAVSADVWPNKQLNHLTVYRRQHETVDVNSLHSKHFSLPELLPASPSSDSPSVWLRCDKVIVKCNIFVSVSGVLWKHLRY